MAVQARVVVQLARDSEVDRRLSADPPPSVESGVVALDHVAADPDGRLGPPEAGEVVMSVLSPEALTRDREEVRQAIRGADRHQPPVIIVEAAEELREEELAVVINAAERADRVAILRIVEDA